MIIESVRNGKSLDEIESCQNEVRFPLWFLSWSLWASVFFRWNV